MSENLQRAAEMFFMAGCVEKMTSEDRDVIAVAVE